MPPPEQQIAQSPVMSGTAGPGSAGAAAGCVPPDGDPAPSPASPRKACSPSVTCSPAGASGGAVAEASITGSLPFPALQLNGAPADGGDTCAARAARSWRELLITGGLHVSHLVHGLAQPGKF